MMSYSLGQLRSAWAAGKYAALNGEAKERPKTHREQAAARMLWELVEQHGAWSAFSLSNPASCGWAECVLMDLYATRGEAACVRAIETVEAKIANQFDDETASQAADLLEYRMEDVKFRRAAMLQTFKA